MFLKTSAAVLGLAVTAVHAGSLSVSNSKGFSSNPLVDRAGILLTSADSVIVAIGTIDPEPAATPGATVGSSAYADLLADFTSYGGSVGLVPSAAPLNLQGVFSFQDRDPGVGTALDGKSIYVIVAKGASLATASEVAILKTAAVFEAADDTSPIPKLVGVGAGLGTVVIVGSDSTYTAVASSLDSAADAAYSLAEVGSFGAAPTDLALSPDSVAENEVSGTPVGTLAATDADAGDSFTYTLVAGGGDADNASFTISGDQLLTAAVFDHETQATAAIRVRVEDSYGLDHEEALSVTITDDRAEDADGDGLTEAEEEDVHGTSDTNPDSDGDGHDDGYEVVHGFDAGSDLDGSGDRDGDGSPDWLETRLGTDGDTAGPGLNFEVLPAGTGEPFARIGPGGSLLGFRLMRSTTPASGWVELENFPAGLPAGQRLDYLDVSAPAGRGFYRLEAYALPVPVTDADGFVWVTVGDPGFPSDPATGFGFAMTAFQIAAHEVAIGQWVEFLNAKEVSSPSSPVDMLFIPAMTSDQNIAGIARSGVDGSYSYEAIGSPERPVTYVSWLDAARFVNWLHNGKGSGDTESGVYDLSLSPELITRAPGATYFLPTRDEWYKAAYCEPGNGGSNYWLFPTRSDVPPGNDLSAGANFGSFRGGDYTLTPGNNTYSASTQYLTQVGSFAGSASYYGTYDQGGSVWEWTETPNGLNREGRGGTWGSGAVYLQSTSSRNDDPTTENAGIGFRVGKPAGP